MKQNRVFYAVTVTGLDSYPSLRDELTELVIENYECSGIQDYSIDEKRVDEILGERAYSGGDVPLEVVDEVTGEAQAQEGTTLIFFFDKEGSEIESQNCFEKLKITYPNLLIVREEKQVDDWDAEWRKHYERIHVSDELEIVPEWELVEKKDNEIYIYPGQGFGTGGHETTFLCLKLFLEIKRESLRGKTCLDFGCGSGILGIAGIRKAQMYVDFCDIDTSALDNTLQNIELNLDDAEKNGHSLVLRDRFVPTGPYELVFANILKPVLISEKPTIIEKLSPSGFLILSGLLNEQVDDIVDYYKDYKLLKRESKGDWSALLLQAQG